MDYRDLMFWASEAEHKMNLERLTQYNAALLPHQESDVIKKTMGDLSHSLREHEFETEVVQTDQENAILIAEAKARRVRHKGRAKARKPGKMAFKCVKTGIPGMARTVKAKV